MLVVGFERDVPLLVELVVGGQTVPLQVVVTPLTTIDAVRSEIDAVIAVIAAPTNAAGDARDRTRILQHCRSGIKLIRERIRDPRSDVPRHRFGSDANTQLEHPVFRYRERAL